MEFGWAQKWCQVMTRAKKVMEPKKPNLRFPQKKDSKVVLRCTVAYEKWIFQQKKTLLEMNNLEYIVYLLRNLRKKSKRF